MGVQVPRRLHPEVSAKGVVWSAASRSRNGLPKAYGATGERSSGRALDARSRPHAAVDTAEVFGGAGGRVHQGEERDSHREDVHEREAQLRRAALLGAWI